MKIEPRDLYKVVINNTELYALVIAKISVGVYSVVLSTNDLIAGPEKTFDIILATQIITFHTHIQQIEEGMFQKKICKAPYLILKNLIRRIEGNKWSE